MPGTKTDDGEVVTDQAARTSQVSAQRGGKTDNATGRGPQPPSLRNLSVVVARESNTEERGRLDRAIRGRGPEHCAATGDTPPSDDTGAAVKGRMEASESP